MLDDAGLQHVQVFASGGLDEYSIDRLVSAGAPIGGFGVGTRVGTSADAPFTDFVYKLVQYDGQPVMKLSEYKVTLPGPKQVTRRVRRQRQDDPRCYPSCGRPAVGRVPPPAETGYGKRHTHRHFAIPERGTIIPRRQGEGVARWAPRRQTFGQLPSGHVGHVAKLGARRKTEASTKYHAR